MNSQRDRAEREDLNAGELREIIEGLDRKVEQLEADKERFVDALDHIERICYGSRTQTRRIRFVGLRAKCALTGDEAWRNAQLPHDDPLIEALRATIAGIYPVATRELDALLDNYATLTSDNKRDATEEELFATISDVEVLADCEALRAFIKSARHNVPEIWREEKNDRGRG